MLYKKNSEKTLSKELFKNPTSEYRGTPFWAWNDYLTKEELERQIEIFNEMGLGGFHMHVRTGLKNQYLSEEFMGLVKHCVEKAKKEKVVKEYPNFKVVATTLREVKTATVNDWSAMCWADGKIYKAADYKAYPLYSWIHCS